MQPRVDVLTLFSYPLHPPGKPERARTEHLPDITVPTVFTHGTSDPFGTIDELRAAAALIAAPDRDRRDHRRAARPGLEDPRRSRARGRCGAASFGTPQAVSPMISYNWTVLTV